MLFSYYVQRMPVKVASLEMKLSISRVKNLKTEGLERLRAVTNVDELLPPEYDQQEECDE